VPPKLVHGDLNLHGDPRAWFEGLYEIF